MDGKMIYNINYIMYTYIYMQSTSSSNDSNTDRQFS